MFFKRNILSIDQIDFMRLIYIMLIILIYNLFMTPSSLNLVSFSFTPSLSTWFCSFSLFLSFQVKCRFHAIKLWWLPAQTTSRIGGCFLQIPTRLLYYCFSYFHSSVMMLWFYFEFVYLYFVFPTQLLSILLLIYDFYDLY